MANPRIQMVLVVAVAAMLCAGTAAQSSCTNVLISMSPCLNYIQGNSSTPSSSCCTQLASVVHSQPQCLCQALNGGGSSLGINVNKTQALALPGACNVQTPSGSICNAASPATPAVSPSATPNSPSTVPSSGTGSKTVPTTDSSSSPSDASSTTTTLSLLFFLLFVASYASTSTTC